MTAFSKLRKNCNNTIIEISRHDFSPNKVYQSNINYSLNLMIARANHKNPIEIMKIIFIKITHFKL